MKLLVSLAVDATPALDLVDEQRIAAMGDLQALTAAKARLTNAPLAEILHLDRTILMAESQVRWLDLVEDRLLDAGWSHGASNPGAMRSDDALDPDPPNKKSRTNKSLKRRVN